MPQFLCLRGGGRLEDFHKFEIDILHRNLKEHFHI